MKKVRYPITTLMNKAADCFFDGKSMGSLYQHLQFIITVVYNFLPPQMYQDFKGFLLNMLKKFWSKILKVLFLRLFSKTKTCIKVEEYKNAQLNDCYSAVQTYIGSKSLPTTRVLQLHRHRNRKKTLTYNMDANQRFEETYQGFKVEWSLCTRQKLVKKLEYKTYNYYLLSFDEKYKEEVQSAYIPHVMEVADMLKLKNRERFLYTNRAPDDYQYQYRDSTWKSVPFSHPSTFDTIAMDPVLKKEIVEDLTEFASRREFYSRVGRAWKRGYLLYGPPGTGKTSLIAAISNFLEFDIYDLELTAVTTNSQLRRLLLSISNKSVIVVEDIDCTLDLSDRKNKKMEKENQTKGTVSLSGLLNFVDGLWSSSGEERLMIFTTNHKDKLDPALLRPGRMDKHINLSYCEIEAFKMLMKNYLNIDKHELVKEVEEVLPLVKMTPAEIAEIFTSCEKDVDNGMKSVLELMKKRFEANEEKKKMKDNKHVQEKEPSKNDSTNDSVEAKQAE